MLVEAPTSLLTVGVLLQFTIPHGRQDAQCCATLLGWKDGSFVISGLPYVDGQPIECEIGQPCVVRYIHEGKVVGYRSEIRGSQVAPEPLLFLSFPEHIEEILLRKHPRIPIHQPISIRRDDGPGQRGSPFPDAPIVGVLRDLSVAGCRASLTGSALPLTAGTVVRLEFDLPGMGHVINLVGCVKNVSSTPRQQLVGFEFQFYRTEFIEFRGWGGTVQKAIEQFVTQRQPVTSVESKN